MAVAAGYNHLLILDADGTVAQVKGGGSQMPLAPSFPLPVTAIAAGVEHSLALLQDGSVTAWAPPYLSGNVNPNTLIPSDAQTGVAAIAAGYHHSLALRTDGRVVQWGSSRAVPQVAGNIVAIAAGLSHSLAVTGDGRV